MMRTACPTTVTVAGTWTGTQTGVITPLPKPLQIGFRQFLHLLLVQIVTLGHIQGHHFSTQL